MGKICYPKDVDAELEKLFDSGRLYHYLPGGKKEGCTVFERPVSPPVKGRNISYSAMMNVFLPWKKMWDDSRICIRDKNWVQLNKKGVYSTYKRIRITSPFEVFRYLRKEQDLYRFLSYVNEHRFPESLKPLMYESQSFREWVYEIHSNVPKVLLEQNSKERIASEILCGIITRCQKIPDKKEFARNVVLPYLGSKFLERNMGKVRQIYNMVNDDYVENRESLAEKLNIQFGIPIFTVFNKGEIINLEESKIESFFKDNIPKKVLFSENNVPVRTFDYKDIIVIGGMGYRVIKLIENINWIHQVKDVYYWGDMDKNGFNILNGVYKVLPRIKSIFMDVQTINRIPDTTMIKDVTETYDKKNYQNLHTEEYKAVEYLSSKCERIEQERIPHEIVQEFIADS